MSRRFVMPGAVTSEVEVSNISQHGFWLLLDGRELFLPFEEFPWFKRAPIEAILVSAKYMCNLRARPLAPVDRPLSEPLRRAPTLLAHVLQDALRRDLGLPRHRADRRPRPCLRRRLRS
ncbi:MAG: DUF2442 domain-containing protein [Solirubrobacteraceae bacterium]